MSTVTLLFPWQKNEKVEMEIQYLLQNFDDDIEENQVQTEINLTQQSAKSNWKK